MEAIRSRGYSALVDEISDLVKEALGCTFDHLRAQDKGTIHDTELVQPFPLKLKPSSGRSLLPSYVNVKILDIKEKPKKREDILGQDVYKKVKQLGLLRGGKILPAV